jgi:uncharacterized protein
MSNLRLARLAVCLAVSAACGACASSVDLDGLAVKSRKQRLFQSTVRQSLDFTCGGASVATMLTYYWGRPTDEVEVLGYIRERYPDPKIWKAKITSGFSFDDLIFAVEVMGYEAIGAKVEIDQLAALSGPVIVHLNKGTFEHFTVLRKVENDTYYMADSVVGDVGLDRAAFKLQYTGNALAIWKADAKLPLGSPLARVRDGIAISPVAGWLMRDTPPRGVAPF